MTDRHIYNQSDASWTFEIVTDGSAGNQFGNVWFSGDGSGQSQNGPWILPPNSTAQIQYTSDGGVIKGAWKITDQLGQSRIFDYSNDQNFPVPPTGNSPYISHDGNTGAVSVNDPADADLSVGSSNW